VRREQGLDLLAKFRIERADLVDVARPLRRIELQRLVERGSGLSVPSVA
jgi:hypothetical protein